MNDNQTLKRLYKGEIQPNDTKAFTFSIPPEYSKIKGVLFSPNTSLSICLSDQKSAVLEKYKYSYVTANRIAPKKRIFTFEASAKNQTLTGTIKNEASQTRTISIYLLLE